MFILFCVLIGFLVYLAIGLGTTYLISRHERYTDPDGAILVTLAWPFFGVWALTMYIAQKGVEHGAASKKKEK